MSLQDIKKEGAAFFSEAIKKWIRLIEIYNIIRNRAHNRSLYVEGNEILVWLQNNYAHFSKFSKFEMHTSDNNGKVVPIDPVFNVIFGGANILNICRNPKQFADELNKGLAQLRGHLSSIKRLTEIDKEEDFPLQRIIKIASRFHLVANQLKRRRKNKTTYLIEDEYDVQTLLLALLRIDFDDIRREDWAPSYAGGASRIDLVLKSEGILIEVKKTNQNLREKQIGDQLLVDIEKYKEYPNVNTLFCFIYDPDSLIENPKGFERDLQKCSAERLKVIALVCPRN